MIKPSADFRANPARAIYIQGTIDEVLANTLAPKILRLQNESRQPITAYIDSRGGSVASAELILRLLRSSNQNSDPPCRVITVVINQAASAAADFLSSGDYAIALPEASIFYHGVRQALPNPITVEFGSALTESLKISNDRSAMALAFKTEGRFMFRFVMARGGFEEIRKRRSHPELSDLTCFIETISEQLSLPAKKLLTRAVKRHARYGDLFEQLRAVAKNPSIRDKSVAEIHGATLKEIVDFEIRAHKDDSEWNLANGGLSRINDDFLLLHEYTTHSQSDYFRSLCQRWGLFAITAEEVAELDGINDQEAKLKTLGEKAEPIFAPIWSFLVALCHVLQEGEDNWLTALDAYWLGLIDEVINHNLDSMRLIKEFAPNLP